MEVGARHKNMLGYGFVIFIILSLKVRIEEMNKLDIWKFVAKAVLSNSKFLIRSSFHRVPSGPSQVSPSAHHDTFSKVL